MNRIVGLAAVSALCATMVARAEETAAEPQGAEKEESSPLSVSVSVDVLSDYMWRGTICNDNPVWQPSVSLTYDAGDFGYVSANVWSSFDLTHKQGSATESRRSCGLQEIDYTLSYGVELFGLGFEVGHIWYTFPNNNGHSDQEVYASVAYDNPILTPSAAVYWNYSDSADTDPSQFYYSFGVSHDFALTDSLTLTPSASLGFGGNAWTKYVTDEAHGTELTDQTVGLALTYAVTDYLSLGAQVNYTWIPSHTLRHSGYDDDEEGERVSEYMGDGKNQICWGGVNATFTF